MKKFYLFFAGIIVAAGLPGSCSTDDVKDVREEEQEPYYAIKNRAFGEYLYLKNQNIGAGGFMLPANTSALTEICLSGNPGAPFSIPAGLYARLTTRSGGHFFAEAQGGGLLADCAYLWLDAYKSRTADLLIESLLEYALLHNEQEQHAAKLLIRDILFRFDSASEAALRIRCTTYAAMTRLYMAKSSYGNFCREYRPLYGEPFKPTFNDIMSRC